MTRIKHGRLGWVPNVRSPIRYSQTPVSAPVAVPSVGQQTDEVLRALTGGDDARIAQLAAAVPLVAPRRQSQIHDGTNVVLI